MESFRNWIKRLESVWLYVAENSVKFKMMCDHVNIIEDDMITILLNSQSMFLF